SGAADASAITRATSTEIANSGDSATINVISVWPVLPQSAPSRPGDVNAIVMKRNQLIQPIIILSPPPETTGVGAVAQSRVRLGLRDAADALLIHRRRIQCAHCLQSSGPRRQAPV